MITTEQRQEILAKIQAEITNTQSLITQYEEVLKPVAPDCAIGRVSRMDTIINNSVAKVSLDSAKQKLLKLQIALEKVPNSDFGICTRCKQSIQIGRLLFIPESNLCVRCSK